jgi:hypothetical protein
MITQMFRKVYNIYWALTLYSTYLDPALDIITTLVRLVIRFNRREMHID